MSRGDVGCETERAIIEGVGTVLILTDVTNLMTVMELIVVLVVIEPREGRWEGRKQLLTALVAPRYSLQILNPWNRRAGLMQAPPNYTSSERH